MRRLRRSRSPQRRRGRRGRGEGNEKRVWVVLLLCVLCASAVSSGVAMNCQTHLYRDHDPQRITRRWFFRDCAVGLGALALAELLGAKVDAGPAPLDDPLSPKKPPHAAKAKRVVYLFMAGGPSHLEMFDHKPQLAKFNGTLPPPELLKGYRAAFIPPTAKLLGPKFKFANYGQCGMELSELLPHLANVADDIAVVRS